jgi:hypothetical protein
MQKAKYMSITRINHERKHIKWIQARGGHRLILLLAAAFAWSACTSQPAATASRVAGTPSRALGGIGSAGTVLATAAPPPVATVAPTPTPNPIRVVRVLPNTQVTSNEQYELNNCSNSTAMHEPFSDAAQISTEVAVSNQATRSDGTIIPVPEPIRSELVQEVEQAYQDALGEARAMLDKSEMVAAPFTRWYITVIWEDSVFAASASFPSDGMTAMAAYTYTQHVPRMGSQKPMPCTA